jgi:hypothetical protein
VICVTWAIDGICYQHLISAIGRRIIMCMLLIAAAYLNST